MQLASRHGFTSVRLYNRITGKLFEDGQLDLDLKVEEYWHSVRDRLPLTLLCSYRGSPSPPRSTPGSWGKSLGGTPISSPRVGRDGGSPWGHGEGPPGEP